MKLLYITNGIKGAGGLERVLAVKASYLADTLGYDVHIVALNHNDAQCFYEFSDKIKIHSVTISGNPFSYIKKYVSGIKSCVKDIQPDVISVCDDGLKGFFLPLLIKAKGIIYERHVSKIIELGSNPSLIKKITTGFKFKLMTQLAKNFDRFVVLTNDNLTEWNGKNVIVISNPLSFYPEQSSNLESKTVIAVGKQSFQKGFDRLLKSWSQVHEKHPDWNLEIYGKYDAAQRLDVLASELNVANSVRFFETEKNIQAKYLASSIYVMSSRFEGFGMVLTEAMACGVPCVSFDCPCGPSDIIKNKEDGFLVPNGDSNALASKIIALIENEELRKTMGQKAKVNVKRYLPEVICQQWDELFKTLTA